MKHIELLPKELIDKIAAGEVVVNGASVLKELLENSIDANSKTITITIKNGGKSLIKVVDDGDGIPHEDLPKAFLRNATSKLSGSLDSISTLGFRGEALASISFAADISVITKTSDEQTGTIARVMENEIISQNEISCNQGTIIEERVISYDSSKTKIFKKRPNRNRSNPRCLHQDCACASGNLISNDLRWEGIVLHKWQRECVTMSCICNGTECGVGHDSN